MPVFGVISAVFMPEPPRLCVLNSLSGVCFAKPFSMTTRSFASSPSSIISKPGDLVVLFLQFDRADARRRPAHRAHLFLVEAYGLALPRGKDDLVGAARELRPLQLVAFLQRDRNDARAADVLEIRRSASFS